MAIVDGPLCSFNARNKFGDVLVNFNWKGLHVMRLRVSPTQPRTAAVMNMRIKIKALGKVSKVFSATSTLVADMKLKTPARKPWNGWWVGVAIKQFQKDNTDYDALLADCIASSAGQGTWRDDAAGLGLAAQTLSVDGNASDHPEMYFHELALYSLAKACWYMEVLDAADVAYTNPLSWDAAAVTAFAARVID